MLSSGHAPLRACGVHGIGRQPVESRLRIHAEDDEQRAQVERFIQRIFKVHFGADVQSFAPCLVSLRDRSGDVTAAAGYRMAAETPLFLERYLVAPIESALVDHEPTLERADVVEIGHLASLRPGHGLRLMSLLGVHLATRDFRWVVGTATTELRGMFDRLGIAPIALGVANPKLLGDEAVHWGSYYDHRPHVLAGHVRRSLARLECLSKRRSG